MLGPLLLCHEEQTSAKPGMASSKRHQAAKHMFGRGMRRSWCTLLSSSRTRCGSKVHMKSKAEQMRNWRVSINQNTTHPNQHNFCFKPPWNYQNPSTHTAPLHTHTHALLENAILSCQPVQGVICLALCCIPISGKKRKGGGTRCERKDQTQNRKGRG